MPGSDILCSLPPAKPAVGTEEPAAAWTHSKPSWREMLVVSWPAWLLYNGWVDGNGMLRCAIGGKTEEVQRRGLDIKSVSRGQVASRSAAWGGREPRKLVAGRRAATIQRFFPRYPLRVTVAAVAPLQHRTPVVWLGGVGESSFVLGIVVCVQRF
jgi:hypothetical protein